MREGGERIYDSHIFQTIPLATDQKSADGSPDTLHSTDLDWRIFSPVDAISFLTSAIMAGETLILGITVGDCGKGRGWAAREEGVMAAQSPGEPPINLHQLQ